MHLLGAAVGTRRDWHALEPAIQTRIHNYYSANDSVLKRAYRAAEAGSKAIGSEGIPSTSPKIHNVDVSKQVAGHSDHVRVVSLR